MNYSLLSLMLIKYKTPAEKYEWENQVFLLNSWYTEDSKKNVLWICNI